MAALCTGNYGLSQNCTDNSKEYFFVKLTDSAYRAVEEYQRNQNKYNTRATIQISGNGGVLSFPSSCGNVGQQFSFSIDDIEGSFECIQQTQNQLDVLGTLPYKMRIHANDDVYETTRHRMAVAEENQKNKCTREIKPNQTDIGRKVKLKNSYSRAINIPPKRDPPLNASPASSTTSSINSMSSIQHNMNGSVGISSISPIGSSLSPLSSSNGASGIGGGSASAISNSFSSNNNNNNSPTLNSSSTSSSSIGNSTIKNSTINANLSSSANVVGQTAASSLSSALSSAAGSGSSGIATGSITSAMGNSYYNGNNGSSTGLRTSNGLGSGNNSSSNRRGTTGSSNSNNSSNRNQRNGGRYMPDITKRKIRERLIHLLALKPFKKPELYARLQNEGIREREKSLISTILKDISIIRDNSYNLKRQIWNDVNEDWPFFTEQEIQMLKRRKPQNLTPPLSSDGGSSTSGQSPTSTHNGSPPPTVKRPSSMNSDRFFEETTSKKQRISHYRKDTNEINRWSRRSATGANDYRDSSHNNPRSRDNHDRSSSYYGSSIVPAKHHQEPEDNSMGLSYSVLGNDVARRISSRDEMMNGHVNSNHHHNNNALNNNNSINHQHINNSNSSSNLNNSSLNKTSSNNGNSNGSAQHQNGSYHHSSSHHNSNSRISTSGSNSSSNSDNRRQNSSPSVNNNLNVGLIGASPTGADTRIGSNDDIIMETSSYVANTNNTNDNNNNHNSNSSRNACSVSPTVGETTPSKAHNYDFSSFTEIKSVEQRRLYKTEFDNDYIEYREHLAKLDAVGKHFKMLDEQLRNEKNNKNYEDIRRKIVHEYTKFKRDKGYQQIKQRFSYLHAKLAHIKALVSQFDKTLSKKIAASSDTNILEPIGNGSSSRSSRPLPANGTVNSTSNYSKVGSSKTPPIRPTTPLSTSKSSSSSLLSSGTTNSSHLPKQENY